MIVLTMVSSRSCIGESTTLRVHRWDSIARRHNRMILMAVNKSLWTPEFVRARARDQDRCAERPSFQSARRALTNSPTVIGHELPSG